MRRPAARDRWLWPLADADLTRPRPLLVRAADSALAARGLAGSGRLAGYSVATQLDVDEAALDYAERTYGRDAAQQLVRAGAPLVVYDVLAKRSGNPDGFAVTIHPSGRVVGWSAGVQDDRPGARLPVDSARVPQYTGVVARSSSGSCRARSSDSPSRWAPASSTHAANDGSSTIWAPNASK